MKFDHLVYTVFLSLFIFLFGLPNWAAAQLIEDFTEELVSSDWNQPVGISFDEKSRGYVWEKAGRVFVLDSLGNKYPDPLIDISEEVLDWIDHGLLGFALDPSFYENGFFYLLYAVDRHHLLYYGTANYDPEVTLINEASIGRITRYTADPATDFKTTLADSRKILLGETITTGIPILLRQHGVGSLVFGTDGSLLASTGDAAFSYPPDVGSQEGTLWEQALADGILLPTENVGSYRSQMLNSLNGKIIRIDPATGNGLASNPFYQANAPRSPQSRLWALGLRNPYRMALQPDTGSHNPAEGNPGTLYVGDVGGSLWDEINIVTKAGQNFGWPLYEGSVERWDFQALYVANQDSPNPLFGINNCTKEFFDFQDLLIQDQADPNFTIPNPCDPSQNLGDNNPHFMHSRPAVCWSNIFWNKPRRAIVPIYQDNGEADTTNVESELVNIAGVNFGGFASIGGNFNIGENFPETYEGAFFSADYSGWIRSFFFDENQELYRVDSLHTDVGDVVSMAMHPQNGCLYYVNVSNKLSRICFGGHRSPIAVLNSDVTYGPSPLSVNFSATNSVAFDSPLTYQWDFGDGGNSDLAEPSHDFMVTTGTPTAFTVQLTVQDTFGFSHTVEQIISVNNTPPVVEITSFDDGDFYPISGPTNLVLEANVSDQEHSNEELSYAWQTRLFHDAHNHPGVIDERKNTFTVLDPLGCLGEIYYYGIELKVTDAAGLSGYDWKEVFPYCGDPIVEPINFNGFAVATGVDLDWQTTNEQDLLRFDLQRSNNITNFQDIAGIPAKGNALSEAQYSFFDASPIFGINYYRLKIIQNSGVYDYSKVLKIKYPLDPELNIFPNPASNLLTIRLEEARGEVLFEVFNAIGQKIKETTWPVDSSEGFEAILSSSDLINGVYFYRIDSGLKNYQGSFMVLR